MFRKWQTLRKRSKGFTLIELMIVVAIIAILAAIAIPQYKKFQLKAKTAEAKTNLGAIRTAEEAYAAEEDVYVLAANYPGKPGSAKQSWDPDKAKGFTSIGFQPAGDVYYTYGVGDSACTVDGAQGTTSGEKTGIKAGTIDIYICASGDLDADGTKAGFQMTDESPDITDLARGEF